MPAQSLQGKTLFITGGASGIGAETARRASAKGANVALVDIDGEGAGRLADTLPSAIGITADVRDYDSLESAVEQTLEQFGGIDIAFANAGIEIAHSSSAVPLVEMERIADINFTGVFRTVRATLPHVIERRGYVLITASLAAIVHAPPLSHYAASKAGVEAFGNGLRMEYRHKGVDVGVAYFGFIDTPMVQRGKSDPILSKFEQERGQNFIGKTYPLSGAGTAVVKGMENRARRVMYPRFIRPLYAIRSLMPRLLERAVKSEEIGRLVDELDQRDLESPERDASHELHDRLLS
ncbi:MAG TPA: SDR family NAD(P)-dependent oxidoreductase [Thermoleophilaceae bacterium]|nr:SDR family NAD(P)-dependent oxidoreductase [Thermoleophilaceae bacterium]